MSRRKTLASKSPSCYSIPSTRLKNVNCVVCKRKFFVPDLSKLNRRGTFIPLLLDCGHPVCNRCVKENIGNCSLCEKRIATGISSQASLLPLNLYALGLIVSSSNRPIENDDEDFLFCDRLSKLRQISKQGCCHECGNQANVNCQQCLVLFCHCCYSKIHGRALQNHTQILIYEGESNSPAAILNSCSPTCYETLNYFCNDCNVACCSSCILRSHKMHNFIELAEKNQTLLPEFNQIYTDIEDTLMRVNQTKEKIEESMLTSNMYELENNDIETKITQHFAYLHGVLQNMEAKLIKQLHQHYDSLKNNLENINIQLRSQEERLTMTLQMASYVKQSFHKVDIQNAINILKDLTDLPCHLMYKDAGCKGTFTFDNSIVAAMENHCSIEMPPISLYSLVRTDELPKNYIVSPLQKKSCTKLYKELPLPKKSDSESTTISIKSEEMEAGYEKKDDSKEESNSKCKVEMAHVVNPSLFFVRKVASKSEFRQLEKNLKQYGDDERTMESLIKFEPDSMCMVKQKNYSEKWYRGRVNAVNTTNDKTFLYDISYLDYGYEECDIPTSRIRNIPECFLELPPQAIRCCLYGLMPKNLHWTNASIIDFMKLTKGADCLISIINSTPDMLYVDLCVVWKEDNNMGPQSMCNLMKTLDYARLDSSRTSQPSANIYVYKKEELSLNKTAVPVQVSINYFESPDTIYVSKIELKNTLLKLENELQEYYKEENLTKMIDIPQKDLPCAVQLAKRKWVRGKIVDILNKNKVKVFCVDWGYTRFFNINELRAIPHVYTSMFNAQAIKISLMHVMPESDGNWKPEARFMLTKLFKNARHVTITYRKEIKDGYSACMYVNNIDISRQLKHAGVVNAFQVSKSSKNNKLFKNLSSLTNRRALISEKFMQDSYDSYSETENDEKKPVEKNETIKDPFKVEVSVQNVITPDCIYVAQTEHKESNAKMILNMQKFYDNYYSESSDNWSEGALCAVYSAKDKSYFRAKILKIKSSTDVLVYFYDMGIEETVTMKDIQILHMKFVKEPTYCFKVKLAGILPCGGSSTWPSLSCTILSHIIQGNSFCKYYITKPVQEEACNNVIPVELWVRQAKIPGPLAPTKIEINSVNRMLVEQGVALPIKNYFAKTDSILAAEFKQQLKDDHQFMLTEEKEVKWFNKESNSEIDETISNESNLSAQNSLMNAIIKLSNKYQICDLINAPECAVKFYNWLPPTEVKEEVFHAIPTYVDNKCTVYLHPKNNADLLAYIESDLQSHCKDIKINKEKIWKAGELCIAQYHHNKKWYRGRIVENLGSIVMVDFVDYGNVEVCEKEYVTDQIRLGHIPIQSTKCIISGLKPGISNGKWMLHDLDRIHALLVDHECKVSILQRQPKHLIVSITLLRPWKCDLLLYLANHMDMSIKIEHKEWNDSENCESEDLKSDSTNRDIIINEKTTNDYDELCTTNASRESLSETYIQDVTFSENVISGNFAEIEPLKIESFNESIKQTDFENISWMDAITLDKQLNACSTPQVHSDEEENDSFNAYKQLTIPQETEYIELILCCNKDPTTSFAQLAENNDVMFPNLFYEYYLQYQAIMSDLQINAYAQPLIESFEKNTPCVTKFSDDIWYRCVITNSQKMPDSLHQQIISLYYVDYGNHEHKVLDLLSSNHGLHTPKEEWLELPTMVVKCTFWGLDFVSEDTTLLASKLNEIYNQTVVARVKAIDGNSIVAEIYKDKMCKELFYAHLIKEGLYQFKNPEEDRSNVNVL
ncbi:RING finger protein 17 isoform X2 [Anoplolepis gracilipes]|uniref:RING finger protein 17 isoform X2 n=1 Tax=Anoplolepis gracilipes TaxID=354296 RepID=UPI003BA0F7EA